MDSLLPDNDWMTLNDTPATTEETESAPVEAAPDVEVGPPEAKTHRDEQRGALAELVDLVGECTGQETKIEAERTALESDMVTQDERDRAALEYKVKQTQESLVKQVETRRLEIEQKYRKGQVSVKAHDQSVRTRLKQEFDLTQQDIKKKYQQALWLAESVLEAEEGKLAEELKKAREKREGQAEQVDVKERDGLTQMALYARRPEPTLAPEGDVALPEAGAEEPAAVYAKQLEFVDKQMVVLSKLGLPKLFVGAAPVGIVVLGVLIAAAIPQALARTLDPQWEGLGIAVGAAIVVLTIVLMILKSKAKKQADDAYVPLREALVTARLANEQMLKLAKQKNEVDLINARKTQKDEVQNAKEKATPAAEEAKQKYEAAVKAAAAEVETKNAALELERKTGLKELENQHKKKIEEINQQYEIRVNEIDQRTLTRETEARRKFETGRGSLENRWADGLKRIQEPIQEDGSVYMDWADPRWKDWKAPSKFPHTIRFGQLQVDVKTIVEEVAKGTPFTLPVPETFAVPALLAYPKQGSLLLHSDGAGRMDAIRGLQTVMTRLLTCIPPGRVRFTLIDPRGLGQSFSGFMHLADYDEALVGGKIWTDSDQIDQKLINLTEHMETVIQKYLRNEFATIDEYNEQAGELAEPYRYLVIADFPRNFSDEAMKRLSSIATTGARCGVYTLVMRDVREESVSGDMHVEDVEAHSVNLIRQGDRWVWKDDVFQRFPLVLDPAATDEDLTRLLHEVGRRAREAKRVEVPFETIAPKPAQFWTGHTEKKLEVAIGKSGATRLQAFKLGTGVAQHSLVAGKTGSGKSTMLHALICNLAMWYSPDEIELYLIDFKKGVEFKTYAMHKLPHARAIAVESDREFGLSVLQRIDVEMNRRAELFRPFKAQNLEMYRETSKQKMPRTLLIIDEFQEFFSEDDKLAQDASLLLDRVVRQGRAFGVHLLLGSQTIGGSSGLSRSTIGQIAVRIALQTSDADSQLILGDGNSAARLLSRPGEAIYNDQNGAVEGNSPFQVAWLPDEQRDVYLEMVNDKVRKSGVEAMVPIVFEGNEPADFKANTFLRELIDAPKYKDIPVPLGWMGDPVAIKAPTSISFRRQSGLNVLIIGQSEESALAIESLMLISTASQLSPAMASYYILDGSPADSPVFGTLAKVASAVPHTVKNVEYRNVPATIHEPALELKKRQESEQSNPPAIFVLIFGLQRFRSLRKSEDMFGGGFSGPGDEEKPPDTGKEFLDLLREGPVNGIHFISWVDTATALDRTLDRGAMRDFDNRILFQMSAADSSNLIDSPAGNKLGANRALAFSEEQGSIEKFRPYAQPDTAWLAEVKAKLAAKASAG